MKKIACKEKGKKGDDWRSQKRSKVHKKKNVMCLKIKGEKDLESPQP